MVANLAINPTTYDAVSLRWSRREMRPGRQLQCVSD